MARKSYRQAVVIFHGMGQQLPMKTVRGFVDAVWQQDLKLIDSDRPVQGSDRERDYNPTWSRPDARTKLYETRRITTEKADNGYYTDFFEYYWAHLVYGTTLEQVQSWIFGLLWRNPFTRVPRDVRLAWTALWLVTLLIAGLALWSVWLRQDETPISTFWSLGGMALSLVSAWFVSNILITHIGDVVRYTRPEPPNIARREEIRRKGVEFLNSLIHERSTSDPKKPHYDRIIVVAHSLGSIVAYDILSECFAHNSRGINLGLGDDTRQPARSELEDFIRHATGLRTLGPAPEEISPERYHDLQDAARHEMNKMGGTWQVSDFVTLGSPLTHAEFLLAKSQEDLHALQTERVLATCPPVMEFEGRTNTRHFSFRQGDVAKLGKLEPGEDDDAAKATLPRWPHHAAVFGYTRWTNIYSPHKAILTGDIGSGPMKAQFELKNGAKSFCGIKDIAVMPKLIDGTSKRDRDHRRRFISHTSYWSMTGGTEIKRKIGENKAVPHHIRTLRDALGLGRTDLADD